MLHFADDIAMITDSEVNLERMQLNLDKTLKENYNMKINIAKTKIFVYNRQQLSTNVKIKYVKRGNFSSFTYPGSKISSNRKNTTVKSYKIG